MDMVGEFNFEHIIINAKKPVLVAFTDRELFEHENQIDMLKALSQEQKPYVKFCLAEMDLQCRLMERLRVTGTPTFLIFFKGIEKGRMIGVTDRDGLNAFLKQSLPNLAL